MQLSPPPSSCLPSSPEMAPGGLGALTNTGDAACLQMTGPFSGGTDDKQNFEQFLTGDNAKKQPTGRETDDKAAEVSAQMWAAFSVNLHATPVTPENAFTPQAEGVVPVSADDRSDADSEATAVDGPASRSTVLASKIGPGSAPVNSPLPLAAFTSGKAAFSLEPAVKTSGQPPVKSEPRDGGVPKRSTTEQGMPVAAVAFDAVTAPQSTRLLDSNFREPAEPVITQKPLTRPDNLTAKELPGPEAPSVKETPITARAQFAASESLFPAAKNTLSVSDQAKTTPAAVTPVEAMPAQVIRPMRNLRAEPTPLNPVMPAGEPIAAETRKVAEEEMAVQAPTLGDLPVTELAADRRPTGLVNTGLAKFAGRTDAGDRPLDSARVSDKKDFLSVLDKGDKGAMESVGTAVAKTESVMRSSNNSTPPARSTEERAVITNAAWGSAAGPVMAANANAGEAVPLPSTVRETVATVMNAIEALQTRGEAAAQAVNLNFDVGPEKLGLHLHMRDGVVHTTFHTNSTELRDALGQEWLAVAPTLMTRELTVAAPVFTGETAGGQSGATTSFSAQGEQLPQRGHAAPETPLPVPARPAGKVAVTPALSPATPLPTVTSSLLNAFA